MLTFSKYMLSYIYKLQLLVVEISIILQLFGTLKRQIKVTKFTHNI